MKSLNYSKKKTSKDQDPTLINKPITGKSSLLKEFISDAQYQRMERAKKLFFIIIVVAYPPFIKKHDKNKYKLVTQIATNAFANNPNRSDYLNIGNEAATQVTAIENFAKAGSNSLNNYFQSNIKNAPKVDGRVDYTSDAKVYQLKNGEMVDAYEVFERSNAKLITAYVQGSLEMRNFIKEKFTGYSVFFEQLDDALDQQENS